MIANKTTCYEQILRAIGQGLEVLSVQAFDLEVDGNNYVVQGQTLRSGTEGSPNPHSLSQVLRMVGAYVDHKRGRLSKVSGRNQWVTIWSRGPTGGEHMERFT